MRLLSYSLFAPSLCTVIIAAGILLDLASVAAGAQQPAVGALAQKESRTPAERKINSQLLFEIYRARGNATEKNVPPGDTGVKVDPKGRAHVDVRVSVTPALETKVRALGGTIVSTFPEYRSVIAWIPLLKLEELAEDPAVLAIEPAAEPTTVR